MIAGVVFDLDDTLYLERDYVRSGFGRVAAVAADRSGLDPSVLFSFLWHGFETSRRGRAFDELVAAFDLSEHCSVEELVSIYRTHEPDISLDPDVKSLLEDIRANGQRLGVITDGSSHSQHAKVAALDLERLVDLVVVTGDWGQEFWKPHERAYEYVRNEWDMDAAQLVYVGDNPLKDFVTPRRLGWVTVRLRREGQLHSNVEAADEHDADHEADHEIAELRELWPLVATSADL